MIFSRAVHIIAALIVCTSCKKENADGKSITPYDETQSTVSTLAGTPGVWGYIDGPATTAQFSSPKQLILDTRPNATYPNGALFVVDQGYNGLVIRVVDPVTGDVGTYLEKGSVASIGDVILDTRVNEGGALLLTDTHTGTVYQVRQNAFGKGILSLVAGGNGGGNADGDLSVAQLDGPTGLAVETSGNIYVFCAYFKTLKKIDVQAHTMTTFAGRPSPLGDVQEPQNGTGIDARFGGDISDLALSADGSTIYFVDYKHHVMGTVGLADAVVTIHIPRRASGTIAGSFSEVALNYPAFVAANSNSNVFFTATYPGNIYNAGHSIFLANFSTQYIYTVVTGKYRGYQDGNGSEAQFGTISGIDATADGKTLFVSDNYNGLIRKVVWLYEGV